MASAWKKKDSGSWFVGFMAFPQPDGKRRRVIVRLPGDQGTTKDEACRIGEHLASCVRYLEGHGDTDLERVAGGQARSLALASLEQHRVITATQAEAFRLSGNPAKLSELPEPAGMPHQIPGTLAHAANQYMKECRSRMARRTIDAYEAVLGRFVAYCGERIDVREAFTRQTLGNFEKERGAALRLSKRRGTGDTRAQPRPPDPQRLRLAGWSSARSPRGEPRQALVEAQARDSRPARDLPAGPDRRHPRRHRRPDCIRQGEALLGRLAVHP
jgi:hypothetical protein